jgi:hypothetical protein
MQQFDMLTSDVQAERISRDAGMATAAAHADRVTPGWTEAAYEFFVGWVAAKPRKFRFMAEDVRADADKAGVAAPPDARAWGIVVTRAARFRIIKRAGYGPQRAAGCHMAPKSIWERAQ